MSTITEGRNADEVAFTLLVQSLADGESHCGRWRATDLPELSVEDVALICRIRAIDMGDHLDWTDILKPTGEGRNAAVLLPALLERAARETIFLDVQEEAERRREDEEQEEALRSGESAESRLGVAGLFRNSHLG